MLRTPLTSLNASNVVKSMMLTGFLPAVPELKSFVPAWNSRIGLRALAARSNSGVVLLYEADSSSTCLWNHRLLRDQAFLSVLARLIVM